MRTIALLALFSMVVFIPFVVSAADLESPRYHLQFDESSVDNANTSPTASTPGYSPFTKDEQTTFQTAGSVVRLTSPGTLTASLNDSTITFGPVPINKSVPVNLTVTSSNELNYQASLQEENHLQTNLGASIPDTSCDQSCSEIIANQWQNSNGFGYTATGTDTPEDFQQGHLYRRLANASQSEEASVIMFGTAASQPRIATVTFKLKTPPDQSEGTYQTLIHFMVLPTF